MIKNLWRKMIERSNMTQNSFADAVGIPPPTMSMIVKGFAAPMTLEQANEMCAALRCKLTDVYSAEIINALYNERIEPKKPKPKRVDTRVKLDPSVFAVLQEQAIKSGTELPMYVNKLLVKEAATLENSAGSRE